MEARLGYRIVETIGEGAFATVFRGVDRNGKSVALKVLEFSSDAQRDKIMRESEIISSLVHPNIVQLLKSDFKDNLVIFVLEVCVFLTCIYLDIYI